MRFSLSYAFQWDEYDKVESADSTVDIKDLFLVICKQGVEDHWPFKQEMSLPRFSEHQRYHMMLISSRAKKQESPLQWVSASSKKRWMQRRDLFVQWPLALFCCVRVDPNDMHYVAVRDAVLKYISWLGGPYEEEKGANHKSKSPYNEKKYFHTPPENADQGCSCSATSFLWHRGSYVVMVSSSLLENARFLFHYHCFDLIH